MDSRRTSSAASGIPMRSGIPRPGGSTSNAEAASSIPRPSSRMGVSGGPMGSYRSASGSSRASMGTAPPTAATSSLLRQPPSSAAPSTRTYGGLAGRISTLAPRPLDPNTSTNMLGDDISSASILLDTSIGVGGGGHKRTVSAAGIGDDSNMSFSVSGVKRPHLRKLSMDGTSPLLLQAELHPAATPRPESPAYEIAVLRTHYEQQLLGEARKYQKLEQEYEAKCKELDRFNRQRVELLDEWDKQQESMRAKEAEWSTKRQTMEDEIVRLRSSNSELTHRNDELFTLSSTQLAELRVKVTLLETDLAKATAEASSAQTRAKMLEDDLGATKAELEDVQNALDDEHKMHTQLIDEARLGGAEQGQKIAEELARQTGHLRKLEAENAHLTAANGRLEHHASNVELLKEEKRSLEAKVRHLDQLRDQLAAAETEVAQLKQDEKKWDHVLRNGDESQVEAAFAAAANVDSPLPKVTAPEVVDRVTLPGYLCLLRGTVAGLSARCSSLASTVEKLRTRNAELEDDAKDVDAKARKSYLELSNLQTSLARAEKTEQRMHDEISRLKSMLASYEEEEKNLNKTSYDAAHAQRISLLEADLAKAKDENAKLSDDFDRVSRELSDKETKMDVDGGHVKSQLEKVKGEKEALEAKVAKLEGEMAQMGRELGEMGKENEMLWLRVGRGEFDQEKQRCLVLRHNPVSVDLEMRKKNLDSLKAENKSLLSRVEQLSSLISSSSTSSSSVGGAGQALIPQSVVDNLKADISALETSIAAKDKAMLRLKQVFSAKANEFREAMQSLFGYKVKFLENGKVKLTSTFNRSTNSTTLIFESEGGNVGKMKLMGEAVKHPGLVNLSALKEYWLDPNGIRQSVPCFLAALNLELYEGCTMAVRRSKFDGEGEDDE